MDLLKYIDVVYNFPTNGKNGLELTKLYADPPAFNYVINWFCDYAKNNNIDHIVGIETRGLIWGAAIAAKTEIPFHLARKPYNLPGDIVRKRFTTRGRHGNLTMVTTNKIEGNVLVVDDVIVSGDTFAAAGELLTEAFFILPSNQFHASVILAGNRNGVNNLTNKGYNVTTLVRVTD